MNETQTWPNGEITQATLRGSNVSFEYLETRRIVDRQRERDRMPTLEYVCGAKASSGLTGGLGSTAWRPSGSSEGRRRSPGSHDIISKPFPHIRCKKDCAVKMLSFHKFAFEIIWLQMTHRPPNPRTTRQSSSVSGFCVKKKNLVCELCSDGRSPKYFRDDEDGTILCSEVGM